MRLLLITGNSEVRQLAAKKLPGCHFTLCANPAEAARLLSETSFDAILADMDIAPVEAFRALDEHAVSTPLIAITAAAGLVFERAADIIFKDQTGWAILPRVVDCAVRCRRAAASSWESNQLAGALFNSSPIAIDVIDADGKVLRWNKSAEQVFGWAESEVIGEFLPTILPDEREAFRATLVQTIADMHRSNGEESRRLRRDGVMVNVNVWTELLYDANGGVSGILSLLVDSSEKLKLEQQLRLAQRLEAVGQLAGGVAHDFNNLLTIISGHSDLALSQLNAEDPVRNNIEEVLKASHCASALTNQLLAFSRGKCSSRKCSTSI